MNVFNALWRWLYLSATQIKNSFVFLTTITAKRIRRFMQIFSRFLHAGDRTKQTRDFFLLTFFRKYTIFFPNWISIHIFLLLFLSTVKASVNSFVCVRWSTSSSQINRRNATKAIRQTNETQNGWTAKAIAVSAAHRLFSNRRVAIGVH